MKIKNYVLILFFFLKINLNSQNSNEKPSINIDSLLCERANVEVKKDLKNGIYRAYFNQGNEIYSKTFEKILNKDFGIKAMIYQSCSEELFLDCYNEVSIPIIKSKFGKEIFEKTILKAKKLDKSGKGERRAKYPNNEMGLLKFIYCQLDNELLKNYKSKQNYPIPTVTLYISNKGKVYDQKIEFCNDEIVIKEIKRIVKLIPIFENATKDGKPVEDTRYLPIHFHKKWKRKTCR